MPEGTEVSQEEFTFQIKAEGEPAAGQEFWYVDSVRLDGGIPQKVTNLGENGTGKTDSEGKVTIHEGEILALFPGEEGCSYEVTETKGYGEGTNWICETPKAEGVLPYQEPQFPSPISINGNPYLSIKN